MREWGVYILWEDNRALYVGKSYDRGERRWRGDHSRKEWAWRVTHREWRPATPNTEDAALALERLLIADLKPLANKQHNGDRGDAFEARVSGGHPDPTFRHYVGGPPPGAGLVDAAVRAAPWLLAAAAAAVLAAVAKGVW